MTTDKITDEHKERLACVYARQSSPGQVRNNQESTDRQRQLVDHAEELGWDRSRIILIDEDLGCSGTTEFGRPGYQRLVSLVKGKEVGLILAVDMTRLGRDNDSWVQLIRYCRFTDVLLADERCVYDPHVPNDQMLLGLMGTFAEYELSQLRLRMITCYRSKAQKGEIYCAIPVGYTLTDGVFTTDPNLRIQHAIATIFDQFTRVESVGALVRWCIDNGLEVPSYKGGQGRGELRWQQASVMRLSNILNNPTYAGAYVHGRRVTEKYMDEDGQIRTRVVRKAKDEWDIVIKDHHESYISWAQYEKNLQQLNANNPNTKRHAAGAVHKGDALLAGLLRCHSCGNKLQVLYSSKGAVRYVCRNGSKQRAGHSVGCFSFQGQSLNQLIAEQVLDIVQPAGISASVRAFELLNAEGLEKRQALADKVQQYQYAADRVFRQFDKTDPENRLVAGELEKRWNASLQCLSMATGELERFDLEKQDNVTPEEHEELLLLGKNLQDVWFAPDTSMILKKKIVRALIEEIIVDLDKEKKLIDIWVHWSGGQHSKHQLTQSTRQPAMQTEFPDHITIIDALREVVDDKSIAQILNRAGIKRETKACWTEKRVENFRKRHGISAFDEKVKQQKGLLLQQEAANRLNISSMSVLRLIRNGHISAKQVFSGAPWIIKASVLELKSVEKAVESMKNGHSGPLTENPNQITLW
ncbi:MAG: hypothetical protein EOL91_10260 [Actinobacteria bacterium]|nr:hypothetical protein [Actinomycetota bacterium]